MCCVRATRRQILRSISLGFGKDGNNMNTTHIKQTSAVALLSGGLALVALAPVAVTPPEFAQSSVSTLALRSQDPGNGPGSGGGQEPPPQPSRPGPPGGSGSGPGPAPAPCSGPCISGPHRQM
jgi:hypothetical protein